MFLASVRAHRIHTGAVPGAGWAFSPVTPEQPRDYVLAFQAMPQHFKARYRKRAPLGIHLLLHVSPDWIRESGDLHDGDNPRNAELYRAAQDFVRDIPGLVAVRMDHDEEGGGVVDIFLAPIFPRQSRLRVNNTRGPDIPEVSVSKLDALWRAQTGERVAYAGLQTLWADHCAKTLDPRIARGRRKSETGREHLSVPEFKAEASQAAALKAEAMAAIQRARQIELEVKAQQDTLETSRRDLASGLTAVRDQEKRLAPKRRPLPAPLARSRPSKCASGGSQPKDEPCRLLWCQERRLSGASRRTCSANGSASRAISGGSRPNGQSSTQTAPASKLGKNVRAPISPRTGPLSTTKKGFTAWEQELKKKVDVTSRAERALREQQAIAEQTRNAAEAQLIENARRIQSDLEALAAQWTQIKNEREKLKDRDDSVASREQRLESDRATFAKERDRQDGEKRSISRQLSTLGDEKAAIDRQRENLERQRLLQISFPRSLDAGITRILDGHIVSRESLDAAPDLQPARGALRHFFDRIEAIEQIRRQQSEVARAAAELKVGLANKEKEISSLLETLTTALNEITPVQSRLSEENRRRVEAARQAQQSARRRRDDSGPDR